MLLGRDELVATLFRETDRALRLRSPLALVYFGIEEAADLRLQFGHFAFDAAVHGAMHRVLKLLNCYDSLGTIAQDEFVLVLPGCNAHNAATMAARMNAEAIACPVSDASGKFTLSGCYGVATARGRSPFMLLGAAEGAFRRARAVGPETVEICDTDRDSSMPAIPVIESEALHW